MALKWRTQKCLPAKIHQALMNCCDRYSSHKMTLRFNDAFFWRFAAIKNVWEESHSGLLARVSCYSGQTQPTQEPWPSPGPGMARAGIMLWANFGMPTLARPGPALASSGPQMEMPPGPGLAQSWQRIGTQVKTRALPRVGFWLVQEWLGYQCHGKFWIFSQIFWIAHALVAKAATKAVPIMAQEMYNKCSHLLTRLPC